MNKTNTKINSNINPNTTNQSYGIGQSSVFGITPSQVITVLGFVALCLICLNSEVSFATALSDHLTKVETTMGSVKKIALPGATVLGGGAALYKGNIQMAVMIALVCILLAVVIGFVGGDMELTK